MSSQNGLSGFLEWASKNSGPTTTTNQIFSTSEVGTTSSEQSKPNLIELQNRVVAAKATNLAYKKALTQTVISNILQSNVKYGPITSPSTNSEHRGPLTITRNGSRKAMESNPFNSSKKLEVDVDVPKLSEPPSTGGSDLRQLSPINKSNFVVNSRETNKEEDYDDTMAALPKPTYSTYSPKMKQKSDTTEVSSQDKETSRSPLNLSLENENPRPHWSQNNAHHHHSPNHQVEIKRKTQKLVQKSLDKISTEMKDLFQTNLQLLNESLDDDSYDIKNVISKGKHHKKDDETKGHRENIKNRIAQLLQKKNANEIPKMTKWRHRRDGRTDPPPQAIIPSGSFFRTLAWSVVSLITHTQAVITKRKQVARPREEDDLAGTFLLFHDACGMWLSRLIRVPVASIAQDSMLDFNLVLFDSMKRKPSKNMLKLLEKRVMQIKVRVRAIVHHLIGLDGAHDSKSNKDLIKYDGFIMPASHLTQFLVTLASDGNFYKSDLLYDFERKLLQFDRHGAAINTVIEVDEARAALLGDGAFLVRVNDKVYDASRFRLLLKDFLLIKVLVSHVILSPWHFGICSNPSDKLASDLVFNYRMVASLLFTIARKDDPFIPSVRVVAEPQRKNSRVGAIINHGINVAAEAIAALADADNNGTNGKKPSFAEKIRSTVKVGAQESAANPNTRSLDVMKGKQLPNHNHSWTSWLTNLYEISDNILVSNDEKQWVENQLLRSRSAFESFDTLQKYLIDIDSFVYAKPMLEPWIAELSLDLNHWLDKLVPYILKSKFDKKEMQQQPKPDEK